MTTQTISVDQLQIGVYICLDLGWMNHPFSFNNFKIRNADQIKTLRELGLTAVRWDPERSDQKPLPRGTAAPAPVAAPAAPSDAENPVTIAKRARIERLRVQREKIARVEQAFTSAAAIVKSLGKDIYARPAETIAQADKLVGEVVDVLLAAPELAVQVMSGKAGSEELYFHSLNVSVLAMILARELKLPAEVVRIVGIGAMFHDVGLNEVPAKIINNPGPLTKAEREFRDLHCVYGLDIGTRAGLATPVLNIIHQHHEHFDGSGFPQRLKAEAIDLLARLVGVVNAYDNLCNPVNVALALTPHEALSQLFAQQRNHFDPKLLQAFIRFMGVYPPGTVVGLSNEALGLVIKVNSARPLRPTLIIYDPDVPKQEAIILDLEEEPDVNITRAIRPGNLPPPVLEYLSPRRRVSYFFDAGNAKPTV